MDVVDLEIGGRAYPAVLVPTRFVERWRGKSEILAPMLFTAWSVHGFGMNRDLCVVGIDGADRVIAVRRLARRRVVAIPGARRVLELEVTAPQPALGEQVRLYDRGHGGKTRRMRDSDRQPRRHLRATRRDPPVR